MGEEPESTPTIAEQGADGIESGWSQLVQHYERCLAENGNTPAGVDWPNPQDLEVRFAIQLGILAGVEKGRRPRLLDVGCGPGLLLDYLASTGKLNSLDYVGIDLSAKMVDAAQTRWPDFTFSVRDICADPFAADSFDVAIMNGVLTERRGLPVPQMSQMARSIILSTYRSTTIGMSFNVMNKNVDWERDDLFHWSFDEVAAFLKDDVTRNYEFKADYGLYEFTTYAWRQPQRQPLRFIDEW